MIDRKKFFAGVRNNPFPNKLSADQVSGMTLILDEWDRRALTDLRLLAYMLGTAFLETAETMQPIKERGGKAYFTKLYDVTGDRPKLARQMGNTTPGDGAKYCGRGLPQLTWKTNYEKMTVALRAANIMIDDGTGRKVSPDLVAFPDLAMRDDIAVFVMFEGMLKGIFSGKKLGDYFTDTKTDWFNARRIVNVLDRAADVQGFAKAFYADLMLAAA